MDPITLMIAAIAGGGKLFEGFASSAAAGMQRQISEGNAALLDKQAAIQAEGAGVARAKGTFEQYRLGKRVDRTIAGQKGYFAAAGLDPYAASPIALAMDSAMQGEADAEIIRATSSLEAAGALTQSANTMQQATATRYQSAALKQKEFTDVVSGIFGAATAFLSPYKSAAGGGGGGFEWAPTPNGPGTYAPTFR